MRYRYAYSPDGLEEFKNGIRWYLAYSEKACDRFIEEVKKRIESICEQPSRYRNTYKFFRETSLKKFPYTIVYFVDEEKQSIIITSVFHHRRNPKKKFRKT